MNIKKGKMFLLFSLKHEYISQELFTFKEGTDLEKIYFFLENSSLPSPSLSSIRLHVSFYLNPGRVLQTLDVFFFDVNS